MRLFFFLLLSSITLQAQQYDVALVGFYNLENLFDTLDTPDVRDTEFTPTGDKRYTGKIYQEKQNNLARVVAEIGTDIHADGLAVLGVCEIENRDVLEDFVKHPNFQRRNYRIVHFDSPDRRGIDVGLIYNPKYFLPLETRTLPVVMPNPGRDSTLSRDILWVKGDLQGEEVHFFVNHWPSRSGGEAASQHKRVYAAEQAKAVMDQVRAENPDAKMILMGDLNDDPISPSVKEVLRGKRKVKDVELLDTYNPMWNLYRAGTGTLAWRDSWNLFDQILLTRGLVDKQVGGWQFRRAYVFNPPYLMQKSGQYRGYPFRTFVGDEYMGGFSDHLPVYTVLVRERG